MIAGSQASEKFLFGAAVGTGMTALAAERGGADFLIILNAGRLRARGTSSLSCYLPLRSSNEWVRHIAETEVLNRCSLPVFMGANVAHPSESIEDIVAKAAEAGFSGIVNFPSAWAIKGRMREVLEMEGVGFGRECELIRSAAAAGLKTLAYVTDNREATRMAECGAQMLCVVVGFTGGSTGVETHLSIEGVAETVDETLRNVPGDIPALVEGGPIITPEDALAVRRLCRAQGYIAGSTIDKLPLEETIEQVVKSYKVINRISDAQPANDPSAGLDGESEEIATVRRQASVAAASGEPVLITGEGGIGKSRLAKHIHASGASGARKPVIVNCNGILPDEAPSVLFGRSAGHGGRGMASSAGLVEAAHQGTLILDEIGHLDPASQALLVDFIDSGEVMRQGSTIPHRVDCHVVATSNHDLEKMMASGRFRRDLYYRLAVHHIDIPPLSERVDDIAAIAEALLSEVGGAGKKRLSNSAHASLLAHDWPGNIRELRNAIVRAAAATSGNLIRAGELGVAGGRERKGGTAPAVFEDEGAGSQGQSPATSSGTPPVTEREWIAAALRRNRYRKSDTAAELGITTRTLYNKIKKYDLR